MKKIKKNAILSFVLLSLTTSIVLPSVQISAESEGATDVIEALPDDDWLHVEGNNIVDKNGKKVWLTGANWFGFNCRERMLLDSYHSDIIADIDMVASKGINVVRIPIATDTLYAWSNGEYPSSTDTFFNNPLVKGLNSYELFNLMLKNFKRVGIKVILDVHSAQTDNQGHTHPLWYKGAITEEVFKEAWVWVADHYKNDDTIIGFDLKNEPHTNVGTMKMKSESAIWDDSNHPNNWKRVAEQTAQAIMKVHPNALILVEGVEMYPQDDVWDQETIDTSPWTGTNDYFGNWWGGNLRGAKKYPINMGANQDQLVYSPHDYGPLVYEQEWFKGEYITASDKEAKKILYEKCWRDNWAYLMESGTSPLLIGEWGGKTEGGDKLLDLNIKYLKSMRDYIVENKYKLHHTFWCINIDSSDTDGLLTRGEGTVFPGGRDLKWNDNKYDNYLLPTLWKNEDGKFQGLDHRIPLGKNGVSLNGNAYNPTEEPSEEPSATPTTKKATPTPTGDDSGYTVSGYVKPSFKYTSDQAKSVLPGFEVKIDGLDISAVTDEEGYFEIKNVPENENYKLSISKEGYLERSLSSVTVNGDIGVSLQTSPIEVWAGDVPKNGAQDNLINMADVIELAKAFNKTSADDGYLSYADFNKDNTVNMNDVIILAMNFNKISSDYPEIDL